MKTTAPSSKTRRSLTALVGAALTLAIAACGADSSSSMVQHADTAAPPADTLDLSDGVVTIDSAGAGEDTAVTPVDTSEPVDTGPPPPGAFGATCTSDEECDDGWCLPAPEGLVCSKSCLETCPSGWRCAGVSRTGDDVHFICVSETAVLCHPCRDNKDCNLDVQASPDLCVSYGDEGSFCGLACVGAGDCPAGYSCQDATTAGGRVAKQCVADAGVCECNGSAKALALSTACRVTNVFGTCDGARACGADGLSACSGEGAALELCNGADDDCDGITDEDIPSQACDLENEHGTCTGQTRCVDAATVCVGLSPAAEACNGRDDDCDGDTDEGFADTDGDGLADCVDPDDDGDLTIDGEDCAPLDARIHPGAVEACNDRDDDCDGDTDEQGATNCASYLQDLDGDGHGSVAAGPRCLCRPDEAEDWVIEGATGDDCDDLTFTTHAGAEEACNGVDDDCDTQIDEGVSSPCGGCSPVCLFDAGGDDDDPLDAEAEGSLNLVEAPDGGLTLASGSVDIPFIWIANSDEDTVSKLNTATGAEVARYAVCNDPSRTAVDLLGDGIVTCRGDGRVAKIAILEADCVDRNGDGMIDTSRDLDGNGIISSNERVASDECVLWTVAPDGVSSGCSKHAGSVGCARAAGVDKDNNIWVGMWNSKRLYKLAPTTGATLQVIELTARPYGLAIAGDQTIYMASRHPFSLVKIDPVLGQLASFAMPDTREAYGLAIDHLGKIWIATGRHTGLSRFDPAAESWRHFGPWSDRGTTRGVAVKLLTDGAQQVVGSRVFVGHHTWSSCSADGQHRTISVVDAGTQTELTPFDLGADHGPVGVAIDVDGNLWTVNQCGSNASKLDAETGAVLGTFPVGSEPYTYSDMTGYALRTITAPSGRFRQRFFGWENKQTRWTAIFVDATLPGHGVTSVRLRYRVADAEAELQSQSWSGYYGSFPPEALPQAIDALGFVIEVEVTLHTDDDAFLPVLHSISAIAQEQ
ncbi:MAG: hypothetical protein CSA66_07535 [Proteobacteria bacterium]|nr:MAG: hypothetical protein CSA66_07535 [Pseudomonadota bacterium]